MRGCGKLRLATAACGGLRRADGNPKRAAQNEIKEEVGAGARSSTTYRHASLAWAAVVGSMSKMQTQRSSADEISPRRGKLVGFAVRNQVHGARP